MKAAYVDTSLLVAIAFGEPGYKRIVRLLSSYDELLSANLLEAELQSALRREQVTASPADLLGMISWVHPDRRLSEEIGVVLSAGYVRGADLWHLAVAVYVDREREVDFLTLDDRQKEIAAALGFGVA